MLRNLLSAAAAVAVVAGGTIVGPALPAAYAQEAQASPWSAVTQSSLADATAAIEAATGGKVMEIRYRNRAGVMGWDAVVATGDDVSFVTIDAAPAAEVAAIAAVDMPDWAAKWQLRQYANTAAQTKVPLADAVSQAQQIARGSAVAAGLAEPLNATNEVAAYQVEVIGSTGRPTRVVIDAKTGRKIVDPQELLTPWTPAKAFLESLN